MSCRCQQFELYAAEAGVPSGPRFADVTEIQRFVDGLRDAWWWRQWYPQVLRVEVYSRPARMGDSVGSWHPELGAGKLEMLEVHWDTLTVLHELSHVLAPARYPGATGHDPAFARTYMELVCIVMGPAAYQQLYESFERAKIEHDVEDRRLGVAVRL